MTWKELKDKISLMTEEEQRQEVAVWGENMNLMKDCSLEKTDEDMYYNSEWNYTCEKSELEPEDKIKRERAYNIDLCMTFERYVEIADKDAERAMAFLKEVYPFNEETEVFIRKRYNMSIGVDPEEN